MEDNKKQQAALEPDLSAAELAILEAYPYYRTPGLSLLKIHLGQGEIEGGLLAKKALMESHPGIATLLPHLYASDGLAKPLLPMPGTHDFVREVAQATTGLMAKLHPIDPPQALIEASLPEIKPDSPPVSVEESEHTQVAEPTNLANLEPDLEVSTPKGSDMSMLEVGDDVDLSTERLELHRSLSDLLNDLLEDDALPHTNGIELKLRSETEPAYINVDSEIDRQPEMQAAGTDEPVETEAEPVMSNEAVLVSPTPTDVEQEVLVATVLEEENGLSAEVSLTATPETKDEPPSLAASRLGWFTKLKLKGAEMHKPTPAETASEKLAVLYQQAVATAHVLERVHELTPSVIAVQPIAKRDAKTTFFNATDMANRSLQPPTAAVSETLAHIYAHQGRIGDAIAMFELLSAKFPEKSANFADHILKLKQQP